MTVGIIQIFYACFSRSFQILMCLMAQLALDKTHFRGQPPVLWLCAQWALITPWVEPHLNVVWVRKAEKNWPNEHSCVHEAVDY